MDFHRFGNKRLRRERLVSSAVRATMLDKVLDGFLRKRSMIGTDDHYFGHVGYILNQRIVVAITVNRDGLFNKFFCGESACHFLTNSPEMAVAALI